MQAIKNGIKTTFRTPGKALLFTLILVLLAALLSVALSVFAAVREYLDDCEDYFHTIVEAEYLGAEYPDKLVYDKELEAAVERHGEQLEALRTSPAVLSFEGAKGFTALAEGLHRSDRLSSDPGAAVLSVYVIGSDPATNAYIATIFDSVYCSKDHSGKMILMRVENVSDTMTLGLENNSTYLVCGHFFTGTSSYLWFQAEELSFAYRGETVTVPAVTRQLESDMGAYGDHLLLARYLMQKNDSCPVQYTSALEDQLPFHQQDATISSGRAFTEEEYRSGARSVIISDFFAATAELAVGDRLALSVNEAEGDAYAALIDPTPAEEYEIVGVYALSNGFSFDLYLPEADTSGPVRAVNGCDLGRFRVKNAQLSEFMQAAAPLEESGFRFTSYDQGYSAAVEPMRDLMDISKVFLLMCAVVVVAALCLYCHVFITRQRDTAQTMLALGSGRGHIRTYFLSSAAVLVIPSAIVGCSLGKLLERSVFRLLARLTESLANEDLTFSSSRIHFMRTLEFSPHIRFYVYAAAGLILVLATALLTLLFSRLAVADRARRKIKKRRTVTPRVHGSSRLSGKLKYALISMRRGYFRTAAVVLLALVVALFFFHLTDSLDGYRAQLDAVRSGTVLKGHATDFSGRLLDGLIVPLHSPWALLKTDLVGEYNVTSNYAHARFLGVTERNGEAIELPEFEPPQTAFAAETLFNQLNSEPLWVASAFADGVPMFYYNKPLELNWIEGGEELFYSSETPCCVLSARMMEESGIELGDTCRFLYGVSFYGSPWFDTAELTVVGAYTASSGGDLIIYPIGETELPTYEKDPDEMYSGYGPRAGSRHWNSFTFTVKDNSDLPKLREALKESGFIPVRGEERNGTYAVIDDDVYLNTTHSMERQIKYVGALYDCLYALTFILGVVLSYLLTTSRKKELALMRALGTGRVRVTANFFAEQAVLCALGLAAGVGIRLIGGGGLDRLRLCLIGAFFVVWTLSSLICAAIGARRKAYNDLADPE